MLFNPNTILQTVQTVLSGSGLYTQPNTHTTVPLIAVTLKPLYDHYTDHALALNISIVLSAHTASGNQSLVELPLSLGSTPSQDYSSDNPLSAFDGMGRLDLAFEDDLDANVRRWFPNRDPSGDIKIHCMALPRPVDIHTPIGPRVDLRNEGDEGLMGAGLSMLPLPPALESEYDIIVSWDLSASPKGTISASSYGETRTVEVRHQLLTLLLALFAVGPSLRRYPSDVSEIPGFGLYWFGDDPSLNIPDLAGYSRELYLKIDQYFPSETLVPYRVFLRESLRGFGGAGFYDSFMLELFRNAPVSAKELKDLLAHEIVHNWPLMDFRPHTSSQEESMWYNEGIATYYQAHLPYYFGLTDKTEFLQRINQLAQAYYTNPAINLTNHEAAKRAWLDPHAQRIPYLRGMMYFTTLDHQIRIASIGTRSVYEPVFELLKRKRSRRSFDLSAWLLLVEAEIGHSALADYHHMENASLIVPPFDCLARLGFGLVRYDQEQFELGFATSSFSARKISGVVSGSRAEEAGIRNGDAIVEAGNMLWQAADNIERHLSYRLSRDGEEFNVTYWPRSYKKVQSFQWRLTETDSVYVVSDLQSTR